MRFGLFLPSGQWPGQTHSEVLDRTIAAAAAAEEAGFDDVWLAEHHFMTYGVCPSATTLASYILGATSRIHVGTAVSVLSTRHPVALAEETALLSLISNGRFSLGVGRGGPWVDLEIFNTGLDRYETAFAESLDLLLHCLTSPVVSANGPTFTFREVPMVPLPRPGIPVYLASTSPETEKLAAERALPMLLGMHIGNAEKAAAIARYGTQAVPHITTGVAFVADTRKEAVSTLERELTTWLGPGLAGYVPVDDRPAPSRDVAAYVRFLCEEHAVGTPDDCVEALVATQEKTGIGHQILLVDSGSQERTLENIARLGREVLPRVSSPAGEGTG